MTADTQSDFLERLCDATNAHDVERVVEMFTEEYRSEMPVHPSRSFTGRDQVRRNWTQIFAAVPDIKADVLQAVQEGDTVWSEWEMRGNRVDGAEHLMRGVMIFTLRDGRASGLRFYLEPVDQAVQTTDESVRELLTGPRP
jgi:ketosteroid isomerase-like protein